MKISEMSIGATIREPLLLKEFTIKQTKANKPYLYAVFTDGVDTLTGQDWDWQTNPSLMPDTTLVAGQVYEVVGSISEYAGNKQVKLVRMSASDLPPHTFAPSGGVDVEEYIEMYHQLRDGIGNENLRDIVHSAMTDNWELFITIPAANGIHHAFVHGLLMHTVDVTRKAKAIAEMTPNVDVDLVVAGALLHDIGKVRTYVLNGALIEMSMEGQLVEHIMLGAMMIDKYRTDQYSGAIDMLLHIIASHHGKLEYGSPTTPRSLEAIIVSAADGIDAAAQTVNEQLKKTVPDAIWTDKVWTQNNRQLLTPKTIKDKIK